LDTKKLNWKKITSNHYTPKSRACHTLSRIGRKIYLYGGYDGKESFANIEIFDIQTQIWSCAEVNFKNEKPSPRNAHAAIVINKKIYIFGGHYQNVHLNDLIIFDTIKSEWSCPSLKDLFL
jgi:N-acetylneuraminic acid mutarotase